MAGFTYQQLQDTLHAGIAPGRAAAQTVYTPNPAKLATAVTNAQLANAQVGKNTTHGFSLKNLGVAARDVGVSTARFLPRAAAEAGVSVAGLFQPNYAAGGTRTPNKVGKILMGSELITPLQQQGIQTAQSHPGGFQAGPIKLSPTATGLALVAGKGIQDVLAVKGGIKGAVTAKTKAVDFKTHVDNTKTAMKNVQTNNLLNAVNKAKAEAPKVAPTEHLNANGADIGQPALHLPSKGIYAKLTPEQQLHLSDETKNIPTSAGDVPHLTQLDILNKSAHKEVPLNELTSQSPNAAKAIEGVPKPNVSEVPVKVSGPANSIEARAIEAKLAPTTGFDEKATFSPKTHAEENAKVASLITTDPEKAVRMVQGSESLGDISGSKLLMGLEEHAHQTNNPELLRTLGKSPLAKDLSTHGQELSLAGGRDPNSAVAHIKSIIDARTKKVIGKNGSITKAINDEVKSAKRNVVAPSKHDWQSFVESIKC